VIASKDESPQEGAFAFPSLYRFGDTLFVNWQFDRDILDPSQPAAANGRFSYTGIIDEIAVYNVVLTVNEIR